MRKRAGLALDPAILDEPSAGLDPELAAAGRPHPGAAGERGQDHAVVPFALGDNAVFLDGERKTMIAQGKPRPARRAQRRAFLTRGGRGAPGPTPGRGLCPGAVALLARLLPSAPETGSRGGHRRPPPGSVRGLDKGNPVTFRGWAGARREGGPAQPPKAPVQYRGGHRRPGERGRILKGRAYPRPSPRFGVDQLSAWVERGIRRAPDQRQPPHRPEVHIDLDFLPKEPACFAGSARDTPSFPPLLHPWRS